MFEPNIEQSCLINEINCPAYLVGKGIAVAVGVACGKIAFTKDQLLQITKNGGKSILCKFHDLTDENINLADGLLLLNSSMHRYFYIFLVNIYIYFQLFILIN